jgi:hypothetical protein
MRNILTLINKLRGVTDEVEKTAYLNQLEDHFTLGLDPYDTIEHEGLAIFLERNSRGNFNPFEYQKELCHLIDRNKEVMVIGSRQIGLSSVLRSAAAYLAITNEKSKVAFVTFNSASIKDAMKLIEYENYSSIVRIQQSTLTIEFVNGSIIKFVNSNSSQSAAFKGTEFDHLVIDNGGFIKDNFAYSVLPSFSRFSGKVVVGTTSSPTTSFMQWLKIGMPEEAQMVIPASMNPMFDENRLNEIKEQIGEKAYKIDYSLES